MKKKIKTIYNQPTTGSKIHLYQLKNPVFEQLKDTISKWV